MVADTYISDGPFGLLLSIPGLLDSILHLTLQVIHVRFQLLFSVDQTNVLDSTEKNTTRSPHENK